jgi:hypothetical protein
MPTPCQKFGDAMAGMPTFMRKGAGLKRPGSYESLT